MESDQDGLERMLEFLNGLEQKKIHYFIEKCSDDGLLVTLTLMGVRVEVEFTPYDMSFSVFKGSEDVSLDRKILDDLIKENWD